jgi:hypothetical protein
MVPVIGGRGWLADAKMNRHAPSGSRGHEARGKGTLDYAKAALVADAAEAGDRQQRCQQERSPLPPRRTCLSPAASACGHR